VSILCIRSEHEIGYLKGHFQSLKGLHVQIKDDTTHIIVTYWVAACIGIHSFAVQHETEEQHQEHSDYDEFDPPHDAFIDKGLTNSEISSSSDPDLSDDQAVPARRVPAHLCQGKKK